MFKDFVTIIVKSGKGGHGSLAMKQDIPDGGDGGAGGNIYLRGDENLNDLSIYDEHAEYSAKRGDDGGKKRKTGNKGKDKVLPVPLTTEVHITNRVTQIITKHRQKLKLLVGGHGGYGSISFSKGRGPVGYSAENAAPKDNHDIYLGQAGRVLKITLVLKLLADVIFIGYPNAGKSSLLNALTNAHVKTAAYEFTTLIPQIAIMEGLRLMDLPGLIEGTNAGKGLGTSWVKHTESSKLVAHVISYENKDPLARYKSLRQELLLIDPKLAAKPELVVLSKNDETDEKTITKTEKEFQKLGLIAISVSIIDEKSLIKLKTELHKSLINS